MCLFRAFSHRWEGEKKENEMTREISSQSPPVRGGGEGRCESEDRAACPPEDNQDWVFWIPFFFFFSSLLVFGFRFSFCSRLNFDSVSGLGRLRIDVRKRRRY